MTAPALPWFEDEDPRALRRWAFAAAIVVGIHAGLIAAYLLWWQTPEAIGDDTDAVTVELTPIDSVADAKQLDVAPAPEEMIEQKPTPPQPEKPPDQPKVEEPPPPEAPTAEVALPPQKPPEKVEEQKTPAPQTSAPVKGGSPRIEPSWETKLVRRLQQYKRYPNDAQSRGEQGVVLLAFSVDRNGRVIARRIVHSSGFAELDKEVMAMLDRAQPLPPFPTTMTQDQLSLSVPIRFSLH